MAKRDREPKAEGQAEEQKPAETAEPNGKAEGKERLKAAIEERIRLRDAAQAAVDAAAAAKAAFRVAEDVVCEILLSEPFNLKTGQSVKLPYLGPDCRVRKPFGGKGERSYKHSLSVPSERPMKEDAPEVDLSE